MKNFAAAALALALFGAAAIAQPADAAARPQPTRELVFKQVEGDDLSLHIFEPAGHEPGNRRPAIVFYFGGGWVGGSASQFYGHAQHLANRGMVAICAEYRTQKSHGATPFDCVMDGKSAMRYVRAHAAELGVDPRRIAVGGGSAGGHVAATTATIANVNDPADDLSVSPVPAAMVLFNPVIDTGPNGYGYDRLKARYHEINPLGHVRPGTPPTIIFVGTADTTTPPEGDRQFKQKMQAAGNRCELHEFEGETHGFFNAGRGKSGDHYAATLKLMDAFLVSLGYLPPSTQTGAKP